MELEGNPGDRGHGDGALGGTMGTGDMGTLGWSSKGTLGMGDVGMGLLEDHGDRGHGDGVLGGLWGHRDVGTWGGDVRGILGTSQAHKEGAWGYGGGVLGYCGDMGALGWSSKGTLRVGDMGMGI